MEPSSKIRFRETRKPARETARYPEEIATVADRRYR